MINVPAGWRKVTDGPVAARGERGADRESGALRQAAPAAGAGTW